ncbi:MAG TPA: DUF1080 domain-containing protein [Pirellulales bacterium]|nr:DUF1080 domain-containing protein [Pirellulales bacterium]
MRSFFLGAVGLYAVRLCAVAMTANWVLVAAPAFGAEDAPGLSLFDRQSLAGWQYGAQPSQGWHMADGMLEGEEGAHPLLAGWTFGDFELQFRYLAENGARLKLALPEAPAGEDGLTLMLTEGEGAGALSQGGRSLAAGGKIDRTKNGWHLARLQRAGSRFSLAIDDKRLYEVQVPPKTRYGLGLSIEKGPVSLDQMRVQEPPGEPIYNGKDLSGWWTPGKLDGWAARDEEIVCLNKDGNYLRTEQEFGNFTLSLAYKMAKGGNSGVGIRTARAGWPSGDGMELQLLDEAPGKPLTRHSTMALYGNLEPIAKADRSQEWNSLAIKAEGYMISAWVNGVLVQQADTSRLPELHRRNLKGWIGLQDHGAKIEFRDLRVLEAPEGPGLEAWYAPHRESSSKQVLNRLMNTESLVLDDHIRSGMVRKFVEEAGEHVLAELTGPGAVVEISRTSNAGQIAFYFDGEARSRVECSLADLHRRIPLVGQDQQPLLTFLPYQKSLKIVLQATGPVDYRFDYVSLPDDVPLAKYVGGESGVERGLLPALSYRNEQLGWGTHREADPLPRQSASPKTIKPGGRAALIELTGAGIVQWTKLQVNPAMLANDDLWLEVKVDGQTEPAIAAPARYLYPGLAGGGGNYPNYVMVDRGGLTNLLAMPYRQGLSLAAVNRGARPISGVGAAVSYEPIANPDDARLAGRLRGIFQPAASSPSRELISQSGRGRWIGIVVKWSPETMPGIDSLAVDGQTLDAWSGLSWNGFLGAADDASDIRRSLSGRRNGLAWRYLLLEPVDFQQSLVLRGAEPAGDRLALFYIETK